MNERKVYNKQIVYYSTMEKITSKLLQAIQNSPAGISTLDFLKGMHICDEFTLKTTLSRLGKSGRIVRLKRGVYSAGPVRDAFSAAQAVFNGYIGFSGALYLHKLIAEMPFTIIVVTSGLSASKNFGSFESKAVPLGEKAIGFENRGGLVVSTRAKTLFDCLYLPKYSVGEPKLFEAYREARLSPSEWAEFESYAKKFGRGRERFSGVKGRVIGGDSNGT